MTNINREKLAQLDSLQLDKGSHASWERGHCALEVVAWLVDDEHTDQPACVDPYIAAFVRNWNDGINDTERRTELLRPLLTLLVGTRGSEALMLRRAWMGVDWDVRTRAPAFLRLAGLDEIADRIEQLPEISSQAGLTDARATIQEARRLANAAGDASRDAAEAAAWAAARVAGWAAARAAALDAALDAAGEAAWDPAWVAACVAAWDSACVAAVADAGDAARAAALDSAGDRLRPTVETIQASAQDLIRRMCALTEES